MKLNVMVATAFFLFSFSCSCHQGLEKLQKDIEIDTDWVLGVSNDADFAKVRVIEI